MRLMGGRFTRSPCYLTAEVPPVLLPPTQVALRALPTLASCGVMMATMRRTSHPLALPALLVAIVGAFHAVRIYLGVTMEEAQEGGWVLRPAAGGAFWDLWKMFDFGPGWDVLQNIYLLGQAGKVGDPCVCVEWGGRCPQQ